MQKILFIACFIVAKTYGMDKTEPINGIETPYALTLVPLDLTSTEPITAIETMGSIQLRALDFAIEKHCEPFWSSKGKKIITIFIFNFNENRMLDPMISFSEKSCAYKELNQHVNELEIFGEEKHFRLWQEPGFRKKIYNAPTVKVDILRKFINERLKLNLSGEEQLRHVQLQLTPIDHFSKRWFAL